MSPADYAVVVPTIGRGTLTPLLKALAEGPGPLPREVIVVNDRPSQPLSLPYLPGLADRLRVLPGAARGPAAARNLGWRATSAEWVVFLDDDVLPDSGWREVLAQDLVVGERVGAVAGRIHVPAPSASRPTDWQRQVMGLADAAWITADIAYRRGALRDVGGFHEGFTAAYREDTDLATRVRAHGYDLVRGRRSTAHPVPEAPWWTSISRQRGNADDVLLRHRYGWRWHRVTGAPRGRRGRHLATTGAAVLAAAAAGRRPRVAAGAGLAWLGLTAEFALRRVLAGPRTGREVAAMAVTSLAIPPLATLHWLRGLWIHRRAARVGLPGGFLAGEAVW